jgi:DNA-binding transcriptional LysR family regulator
MVEGKLGITMLPSKICQNIYSLDLVVLPISESAVNLELGMIWKKEKYLSFAVREFIACAESYLENGL